MGLFFGASTPVLVVSHVGQDPIMIDGHMTATSRLDFARICVEVGMDFDFPTSVSMINRSSGKEEAVQVDYEWQPVPCCHCAIFGHEEKACAIKASMMAKTKETEKQLVYESDKGCPLVTSEAEALQ